MSASRIKQLTLLVLAGLLLTVTLSGAGTADAMPSGPDPTTSNRALPLDPSSVFPGPYPADFDLTSPAPAPMEPSHDTLDAGEFDAWLKAVKTAVAAQPALPDQDEDDELWATIDACMEADMIGDPDDPSDDTPGAAIAIVRDEEYAYRQGYGVKHLEEGGDVDHETLFRIGSTTKMMTAAAVMQLVEQEAVALDEPVTTYLPDFDLADPWDPSLVTLHNLLTHTSGIPDNYYVADPNTPLLDWVPSWSAFPLYAAPGSYWNYSNPNFSLAGAVVETISQMPYDDYMSQQVYEPAGMPLTTLKPSDVISHTNYSTGHSGDTRVAPGDNNYPMVAPAGYAWSTPTEMTKWAMILGVNSSSILTPESAFLMQERHAPLGTRPWSDYGYGIFVNDYRDIEDQEYYVTVYDHGGNTEGFSSQLFWVPERGFAVSILANTIRSLSSAAQCAVREVAGLERIPTGDLGTGPEQWVDHVGTYSMLDVVMWPFTANVRIDDDTLMMDYVDVDGHALVLGDDFPLDNAFLDVFVAQTPSFLLPSSLDITFVRDIEDESRVRFARNRNVVGQRVGQFPARVAVEGDGCTDVEMTSELDMNNLQITASGLNQPIRLADVPIPQDDPEDYSTASFKYDFTVEDSLGLFYAKLVGQQTDALRFYLLRDADEDGDFVFPDEAVTGGVGVPFYQLMLAEQVLPAGDYQLWVHGTYIPAGSSTFNLEMTHLYGPNLRLENRPRGLADGAEWTMQVCGQDVDDLTGPSQGALTFEYGSPPRLFRTMVDWTPGAAPTPTPPPGWEIFLPWSARE